MSNIPDEVEVRLPIASIDAALQALAKFPYEQAQPHIDMIRARTNEAIQAQQAQQAALTQENKS